MKVYKISEMPPPEGFRFKCVRPINQTLTRRGQRYFTNAGRMIDWDPVLWKSDSDIIVTLAEVAKAIKGRHAY